MHALAQWRAGSSAFWFTERAREASSALRPMSSARLAGLSILVVEDEPLLRKRYSAYLASDGADVTAVGTLHEAGNALEGLDVDVVLLDVHLPDGKGTDLLRANKLSPTTTALVMTAEGGVNGAVEAMRLGAADYLAKPFDIAELPVRVMRARRSQQAKRAEEFRREGAGGGASEEGFFFGRALAPVEEQLRKI